MQLLESHFTDLLDPQDKLQNWRKKAWDKFQEIGLPRPREEAFRYLRLKDFELPKPAEPPEYTAENSADIVFVDGYLQKTSLPSPLICLPLDEAMRTYGIFLQNRWMRALKEEKDPLAALNGALQGKGAFLYIPPNCQIENPIELLNLFQSPFAASPRLHIYLGKQSKLILIQNIVGSPHSFCNGLIDVVLDEGAQFNFQEIQNLHPSSRHFQTFHASLKRDSKLKTLVYTRGASLVRSSMKIELLEEGSEAELRGLSDLSYSAENHTYIVMEHIAPHCRSRQHFKTVLQEKSRSSFEGKILVRPAAQQTESYQLNNNLLLSDEATAYSKPNLEIFADDVKASHGATIAQLDAEELFYLQTRGLTKEEAIQWRIDGFKKEILDQAHISLRKKV